jgi:hypothetical protein
MDRATEAHRSAAICALIGVVGTVIGLLGYWRYSEPALRLAQSFGLLVNAGALALLWTRRPPYSRALANALFLIVLVPTVTHVWMADEVIAAHTEQWVPYEPNKLSALTLAVIAPPGWATGAIGILMFVGTAVVHQLAFANPYRAYEATNEPMGVLAYGAFALLLLWFRQRGHRLREELARTRSEMLALERVANVAMAVRDLANTSVQTLELVRQELLILAPELRVHTDRMHRALKQLRKLSELLMPYQNAVPWHDVAVRALEDELPPLPPRAAGTPAAGAAPTREPRARRPPE